MRRGYGFASWSVVGGSNQRKQPAWLGRWASAVAFTGILAMLSLSTAVPGAQQEEGAVVSQWPWGQLTW